MSSPASGPCSSATATALFSSTTGESVRREGAAKGAAIWGQSSRLAGFPGAAGRQVAAPGVALVEDQVDDGEHGGKSVGQQVGGRHPKRDPGGPDLVLRAHQSLGHRRLRDQESARNLARGQAAERPQGESDLCIGSECRMTAGEDEFEPLIWKRRRVRAILYRLGHVEQAGLRGQLAIAANAVDGPVPRRRHEPGAGIRGDAVSGPAFCGDGEGLLRGFLGEVEVAEEADQRSEDTAPVVAESLLEDRYRSTIGRTSTAPPIRAAGIRDASSIAASRSAASKKR